MRGSTLALLRSWEQLALKLAHDFALRLDELYQLFISYVVKVAGLADFFLLGEQVRYASVSRDGHVLKLLVEQLNHLREMAGRERIFGAGAGSFRQDQAA